MVDPVALVHTYGVDQVRYYLMDAVSFGGDGDFSDDVLVSFPLCLFPRVLFPRVLCFLKTGAPRPESVIEIGATEAKTRVSKTSGDDADQK